jgi:hypothetical protein
MCGKYSDINGSSIKPCCLFMGCQSRGYRIFCRNGFRNDGAAVNYYYLYFNGYGCLWLCRNQQCYRRNDFRRYINRYSFTFYDMPGDIIQPYRLRRNHLRMESLRLAFGCDWICCCGHSDRNHHVHCSVGKYHRMCFYRVCYSECY